MRSATLKSARKRGFFPRGGLKENLLVETKVETIRQKMRFDGRKSLKRMARLEGFEPPTLRSEECCSSFNQLLRDNASLILLPFFGFTQLTKAQIA
jgi:hypothetical protein